MKERPEASIELMSNQPARRENEPEIQLSGWIPRSPADKERIRDQVARILSSPLFRKAASTIHGLCG